MSRTRVPAVEGWFTLDDEPRLLGTRCTDSGTYYFPPETTMSRAPGYADSTLEQVELSRRGTIWSFTNAGYQPPEPYIPTSEPYEPFAIAAVELAAEQIVVLGQVVSGVGVEDLRIGMEMELVLETLYSDEENDYVVWKWKPVAGAAGDTKEPADD